MKLPKVLQTSVRVLIPAFAIITSSQASAELFWDAAPGTAGMQDNPSGTAVQWNTTNTNWLVHPTDGPNVTWNNSGDEIAVIGTGAGTALTRQIDVIGDINLFAIAIYGPQAYRLAGSGTLNFSEGGIITVGLGSTSAGSQIALNSGISGSDLTFIVEGLTEQFVNINGEKNWTGNLDLGGGANFFVQANGGSTLNSLDSISLGSGTTLALAGDNQAYSPDISIAGTGPNNRGAIRVSSNNITMSGRITLSDHAMISLQDSGNNPKTGYITAGIGESFGNRNFTKSGTGELFIRGASNYTGETIVAPVGATVNPGTLTLDFANATPTVPGNPGSVPLANLLYNGVTANRLNLVGNTAGLAATLKVIGRDGVNNTQTFGGVDFSNLGEIVVTSGVGGTVTLELGSILRTGGGFLQITGPAAGSVKVSNSGLFLPFVSYTTGGTVAWAGISAGELVEFTGNLAYQTGTDVSALPGYTAASNLRIGGGSTGNVSLAGNTALNSVSMVDSSTARTIAIGATETLRFGSGGGIQLVSTAKELSVGSAPGVGTITAGTSAADLFLSNFSADQALVINSKIADNSGGAVSINVNGGGVVRLTAANTYTGVTEIDVSGVLRAEHNQALGTTGGNTAISAGGALELANNLTDFNETISASGGGINNGGAIRNVSGSNHFTGTLAVTSGTRIGSDSGRLILGSAPTENVITGSSVTFSGEGQTEVAGRIAIGSGSVTKSGNGTLILGGHNTYTGATSVSGGALRVTHANSLGTSGGGVTLSGSGSLELAGGVTITGESLSTSASNASGAIRSLNGANTYAGAITLTANTRIQSDVGSVLTLDVASGNAITSANAGTSNRFLVFGGPGATIIKDPIAHSGTGSINFSKEGIGDLTLQNTATLQGSSLSPNINLYGGRLILDHSLTSSILSTSYTISMNGGTLEVKGGAGTTTPQLGELLLVSSAGYSNMVVGPNTTLTTGVWNRPSGHFLFVDLSAPGSKILASPGSLAGEGRLVVGTTSTGIGSNASFVMKDADGRYDFTAVTEIGGVDTITRLNATTGLPTQGGSGSTPSVLAFPSGTSTHTLTSATSASTLRVDTTQGAGVLDLGSNTLNINRAALILDGDNDFTIAGTGIVKGNAADAIFLYHYGTGTLNVEAKLDDGNGQVFLAGTGLFDWKSDANAAGNMWFLGETTVRVGANTIDHSNATSGVGAGQIRIGSGAILELAGADLTRNITGGNGGVAFLNGDGGGFSAFGADRIVDLQSGGSRADLTWGSGSFLGNGEKLILGSPHANAVVDLKNNLNLNNGNQIVDVQSINATGIGGRISGNVTDSTGASNGSLTKIGRGILTLAGTNAYKGHTTVSAGTLDITGSLTDTELVTVFDAAKLQVRGSGELTASAYSLLHGSEISLELGATTGTKLQAKHRFSLEGDIKLSILLTADPLDGTEFTLLDGASTLTGYANGARFFSGGTVLNEGSIFDVVSNGFLQSFQITYLAGDGADVAVLAVPEPGTAMALLTSMGLLLGVNRFRRRSERPRLG